VFYFSVFAYSILFSFFVFFSRSVFLCHFVHAYSGAHGKSKLLIILTSPTIINVMGYRMRRLSRKIPRKICLFKENKVFASSTPHRDSKLETQEVLRKMCAEISVTPKLECRGSSSEAAAFRQFSPKVTPNAERLNMFNHSAYFNMSLSPVILNGAVTITPR
jgi:hypothetical protein